MLGNRLYMKEWAKLIKARDGNAGYRTFSEKGNLAWSGMASLKVEGGQM